MQPGLDEQRDFVAGERLALLVELGDPRDGKFGDIRVHDRIQLFPLRLVSENDLCHALSVELAVWVEHIGPERARDRREGRGAPRDGPAGQLVGVDHGQPASSKARGHGALAGANPAGQAENVNRHRR